MKTTRDLVRKARTLYNSEWATPELNRRNRKAWVRSVQYLGPKWVYWDTIELRRTNATK
jgi:hypothetical protein